MNPPIDVIPTPPFKKQLKGLLKHYRHVKEDIAPFIAQLSNGELPGNQIPSLKHTVYKVRIANRDAQRGKSGGYRMLYYVRKRDRIYLIAIYSKSDQEDIDPGLIAATIDEIDD